MRIGRETEADAIRNQREPEMNIPAESFGIYPGWHIFLFRSKLREM
jgi:hypothetical protein